MSEDEEVLRRVSRHPGGRQPFGKQLAHHLAPRRGNVVKLSFGLDLLRSRARDHSEKLNRSAVLRAHRALRRQPLEPDLRFGTSHQDLSDLQ
jgi:hypothetical protein